MKTKKYLKYYIILIALILRLIGISTFSIDKAEYHFLNLNYRIFNPLLYNLLVSFLKIFFKGLLEERIISLIFGVLSIYLVFYLGEILIGKRYGFIPALLLTTSPLHIIQSQQATFFTLYVFVILLLFYFSSKILLLGENKFIVFSLLVNLIGILTLHPFLYFVFFSQYLLFFLLNYNKFSLIFKEKISSQNFLKKFAFPTFLFILNVFSPLIYLLLINYQKLQIFSLYILSEEELPIFPIFYPFIRLIHTYIWVFANFCNYFYGNLPNILNFKDITYLFLSFIIYHYFLLISLKEKSSRKNFLVCSFFIPITFISILVGDLKTLSFFTVPFSIIFYFLITIGYKNSKSKFLRLCFITSILISIIFMLPKAYNKNQRIEIDWQEIKNIVEKNIRPQDGILILDKDYLLCFKYYFKKDNYLIENPIDEVNILKYKRLWLFIPEDEERMIVEQIYFYNSIKNKKKLIWEKKILGSLKINLFK